MSNAISNALSGAFAAVRREEVAASNIANLRSRAAPKGSTESEAADGTPLFRPGQAVESSVATGGVSSRIAAIDPSSLQQFEPDAPDAGADGFVDRPNVDLGEQQVGQIVAQRAFEANLKVIQTASDMEKSLLDITS
jgi:flagellar basal-body rod protein FlgC